MQVIFQVLNPRPLKGSFVYERTNSQTTHDKIDEALYLLAERLSTSISSEPFQINKHTNVNISNFSDSDFNSRKTINLIFRCFNKKESDYEIDKEKIIPMRLYFDSADKEYIDKIIEVDQYMSISKKSFDLIDTLITYKD